VSINIATPEPTMLHGDKAREPAPSAKAGYDTMPASSVCEAATQRWIGIFSEEGMTMDCVLPRGDQADPKATAPSTVAAGEQAITPVAVLIERVFRGCVFCRCDHVARQVLVWVWLPSS